jgi:ATP-dependent DNA helicase DinG
MIEHFPKKFKAKNIQKNLIEKIDNAFKKKKYVIVSAPTGTGKSFLSATLANSSSNATEIFKNSVNSYEAYAQNENGKYESEEELSKEPPFGAFVLTITKSLQDQYSSLFEEDCKVFKGKSNYMCNLDQQSDVEIAPCLMLSKIKEDCWRKNFCSYYNARNEALTYNFSALNYKIFFTLPNHLKRKEYLICDEASELENEIVKNFTLSIDFDKIRKYEIPIERLNSDDFYKAIKWVENSDDIISKHLDELKNALSKKKNNISDKEKAEYLYVKNLSNNFSNILKYRDDASWIVDRQKNIVNFIPLRVDILSKNIFEHSEKVLLMSATIVDHVKFAKNLGIEEYEYIEADSSFESNKSPIYISTKHKLNYTNLNEKLPLIAEQIKQICKMHENVKGIIHTHTMNIANLLKKYLGENDRFLFRDKESTNDMILSEHFESSNPTVLVSPSLTYGIDLKDEMGRFCIVVKLPYLPLSDKRIKKIFENDKIWYNNAMLNGLVQMCGRCTRSENDFSDTYILDGNIEQIVLKNKDKLPKYFLDRFK